MDNYENTGYLPSAVVTQVVRQIVEICAPSKVYLYNQRVNARGRTSAFKLCVILPSADKNEAERAIYREIDCDVPYDIILYTCGEWEKLAKSPVSFAHKIVETGMVVYG